MHRPDQKDIPKWIVEQWNCKISELPFTNEDWYTFVETVSNHNTLGKVWEIHQARQMHMHEMINDNVNLMPDMCELNPNDLPKYHYEDNLRQIMHLPEFINMMLRQTMPEDLPDDAKMYEVDKEMFKAWVKSWNDQTQWITMKHHAR